MFEHHLKQFCSYKAEQAATRFNKETFCVSCLLTDNYVGVDLVVCFEFEKAWNDFFIYQTCMYLQNMKSETQKAVRYNDVLFKS